MIENIDLLLFSVTDVVYYYTVTLFKRAKEGWVLEKPDTHVVSQIVVLYFKS